MNKFLKTVLIISIVFFSNFLLAKLAEAASDDLVVEFERSPLFEEANFLPGDSVSRWIKVTNNTSETKRIATEAINVSDPDNLGDVLAFQIKEGEDLLFSGTLSDFFEAGELFLSQLEGNGSQTQYDFIVTFFPEASENYQGKSLSFDILIGFQGEEEKKSAGGGGGWLPPGLTILEESVRVIDITQTSATVLWTTSYPSTSQVIYSPEGDPHTLDLSAPNYGYTFAFPVPEDSNKVRNHSVTLVNLTPGTTYYFRCVSHASPLTITREYNFATLPFVKEKSPEISETEKEKETKKEEKIKEEKKEERGVVLKVGGKEEVKEKGEEEKARMFEKESPSLEEKGFPNLLASIFNSLGKLGEKYLSCLPWWVILIISGYCLIKASFVIKKRKKKEGIIWIIYFLITLILAAIFYYFKYLCVDTWFILILVIILLLIFRYLKKKEKISQPPPISPPLS